MPRNTPTTTTTFRLTAADRRNLHLLEEELGCSKAEIVRLGLGALRRDPDLRRQLRGERVAAAFLARLKDEHGPHVQLRISLRPGDGPIAARWLMSRRSPRGELAVDSNELQVRQRHDGDTYWIDLVDPQTGVGIYNAWWQTTDENVDAIFPIAGVNFWRTAPLDEPTVVELPGGRKAIEVEQDDGTLVRYVLGSDGTMALLHDEQRAAWFRNGDAR